MKPISSIRIPGHENYVIEKLGNEIKWFYHFLSNDGYMFSCSGGSLDECRFLKNKWQIERILGPMGEKDYSSNKYTFPHAWTTNCPRCEHWEGNKDDGSICPYRYGDCTDNFKTLNDPDEYGFMD